MFRKLRKIIKWVFITLLSFLLLLIIFNWSLVSYAILQGKGQLTIIWKARPVDEVLADPTFPDSLKSKLRLIEEVRRYAVDSLGLKDTHNYRSLYDQQGREVMWVVTASEAFQLLAKEWDFPIVGSVPYKGFFEKRLAQKLADELEAEGWDVNVRNPGGWSTLGWFSDPILSKMLEKSEGDLASLIIHEMVHATIFVKDSVDFNENLASFIGDRGAEMFLKVRFGVNSKEYQTYIEEDHDYILYVDHILRGTRKLDSLYQAMADKSEAIKIKLKQQTIQKIVGTMDTLSFLSQMKPSKRFTDNLPNNAYFMSFIHYQSGQDELWQEWEETFSGDLSSYITFLSNKYPFL